MNTKKILFASTALALNALSSASAQNATPTPVDTEIKNKATAYFIDPTKPTNSPPAHEGSNEVVTKVAEFCSFDISDDSSNFASSINELKFKEQTVGRSSEVVLNYVIHNYSNKKKTFPLEVELFDHLAKSIPWDKGGLEPTFDLYEDSDGNGAYDPNVDKKIGDDKSSNLEVKDVDKESDRKVFLVFKSTAHGGTGGYTKYYTNLKTTYKCPTNLKNVTYPNKTPHKDDQNNPVPNDIKSPEAQNVYKVSITNASLQVDKTVSKKSFDATFGNNPQAANQITYTVSVANNGNEDVSDLVLTDVFPKEAILLQVKDHKKSTPAASVDLQPTEYTAEYYDGTTWSTTVPSSLENAKGYQIKLKGLFKQGEKISFDVVMYVDAKKHQPNSIPETITNKATTKGLSIGKIPITDSKNNRVDVNYKVGVLIGDKDRADAGTPSGNYNDDEQKVNVNNSPSEFCAVHKVENTGILADTFNIQTTLPSSISLVKINDITNTPPTSIPINKPYPTVDLGAGESKTIEICYSIVNPLQPVFGEKVKIELVGKKYKAKNVTYDVISSAEPKPQIEKDYEKPVNARANQKVTFLLKIKDLKPTMTNLVVTDYLPEYFEFSGAAEVENVGSPSSKPVKINFRPVKTAGGIVEHIADFNNNTPGFLNGLELDNLDGKTDNQVTIKFEVLVKKDEKAGYRNDFDLKYKFGSTDKYIPKTGVPVPYKEKPKITVYKNILNKKSSYDVGDEIEFQLTINNEDSKENFDPLFVYDYLEQEQVDALEFIKTVKVTRSINNTETLLNKVKSPSSDTEYSVEGPKDMVVPKSIRFNQNPSTKPLKDVVEWQIGGGIKAQETVTITYTMKVKPEAVKYNGVNNIVLAGDGDSEVTHQDSKASIVAGKLKISGDLLGIVYVDKNRNGIYEKEFDMPVNSARVILAGGKMSVTDKEGRYSFLDLPLGTHAVRLDYNSLPYKPLVTPREGGLVGTQTVHIIGLTSADFPLAPVAGDIQASRVTKVDSDLYTLEKRVFKTKNGYVVNLYLNSKGGSFAIDMFDPLPDGATLKEGSNKYTGDVAGQKLFTYSFDFAGELREAVTDPVIK